MTNVTRISYGILALTIVLVGVLHLGPPFLCILFSFFVLRRLYALARNKWLAVLLFLLVVAGIAYCATYLTRAAVKALPEIAENSIPAAISWAKARQIELPFTDFDSLRDTLVTTLKEEARNIAMFARNAGTALVFGIIGIVVAVSLFFNGRIDIYRPTDAIKNNLYSFLSEEVAARFGDFYRSFSTVIGAQLVISLINTVLTACFVLAVGLPHAPLVIAVTFICGLLPIVGNLVSNTIIVFLAFTLSIKVAIAALIFLIVIHKGEYFLNSKIIGDRIRNPVWLTLLGLVIGERLMGVPGMILAPVVLNYLRVELSRIAIPIREPGL